MAGSILGPVTMTNRRLSTARRAGWCRGGDASQEVGADPGSADGDDAQTFVALVSQFGAQLVAVTERGWIEARHIPSEVVVSLGPLADVGQVWTEPVGDDVVGGADEDRLVANLPYRSI